MQTLALDLRLTGYRYHPAVGGAEQLGRWLLRELGERVHADVVTLTTSNRSDWLKLLIDGERSEPGTYAVDGRRVTALARWSLPVRRRLKLLAPFYHFPQSYAPTVMGRLLAPELEARPTRLVHNIFMGREAFSLGWLLAARRAAVPFVFTPLRHQRPLGWNSPAFRQLYREADAVIALTEVEARWLIGQGSHPDRTHVIGLGPSNDPRASPRVAWERVGGGKIVLFLGQLHRYKGFAALLEAARSFQNREDVRFVFAGPDIRGHARVFATPRPNVTYLDRVDAPLRDSLLQACTLLCVPSSRESFGAVLLEAWSCGKPVIGGPAPATAALIDDGRDGFIVRQEPTQIAGALRQLLDDDALSRRLGEAGKQKVAQRYTWPAIAEQHLQIYERLWARSRSSA